jgi:hypothetical protein
VAEFCTHFLGARPREQSAPRFVDISIHRFTSLSSGYVVQVRLNAVGAYDQALLEGRVRGARLKRHHVAPAYLPHYPHVGRISHKRLADLAPVNSATAVLEDDFVPFT